MKKKEVEWIEEDRIFHEVFGEVDDSHIWKFEKDKDVDEPDTPDIVMTVDTYFVRKALKKYKELTLKKVIEEIDKMKKEMFHMLETSRNLEQVSYSQHKLIQAFIDEELEGLKLTLNNEKE